MSFVIAGIIDNKLYMACDGQVTNEDGTIKSNNYKKIKKVGTNVLIGYAGTLQICEKALEEMHNLNNLYIDNVYELAQVIVNNLNMIYSENHINRNLHKAQIIVGSHNQLYSINSINNTINRINTPKLPKIEFVKVIPPNLSSTTIDQIIESEFSYGITNIQKQLKNIVIEISKKDSTVNNNVYVEYI